MSKPRFGIDKIFRIVVLILAAVLCLSAFVIFVLVIFIPVAGWLIWQLSDKNKELEERLAAIEGPHKPKHDQS